MNHDLLQKFIASLKAHHLPVFLLGTVALLFSGCTHHYGPPMFGKQNLYMAKPAYDSVHNSEIYGSVDMGMHSGYNENESNFYLMPSVHRAHAFSAFDVSYGIFGYGGGYNVTNLPEEKGLKGFYGGGARGSANINLRFGNFEWRILGIEGSYSQEFGGYRQMRADYPESDVDTLKMYNHSGRSVNFGLSTEFVFGAENENYTAYKASLGIAENNKKNASDALYFQLGGNRKMEQFLLSMSLYLTAGFGGTHLGLTGGVQVPLSQLKSID